MAKDKSTLKDRVASFRINKDIDAKIEARIAGQIANCNCSNKFYRKLALDWFHGRIAYKNPDDFKFDPDILDAMQSLEPAQSPAQAG